MLSRSDWHLAGGDDPLSCVGWGLGRGTVLGDLAKPLALSLTALLFVEVSRAHIEGATDRGQYRQAAGATSAEGLAAALSASRAMMRQWRAKSRYVARSTSSAA
jgi:hypothetical protein